MTTTFSTALLARGASPAYARKMAATIARAGADPSAFLLSLAATSTQATLDDYRNRLRIYAGWLESEGRTEEAARYQNLPRPVAGKRAQDRASFTLDEIRKLVGCKDIPDWRRTAYRVMATLGLRPVEVSRLRPEHLQRSGGAWVLALPATMQKSGRPDTLPVDAKLAQAIIRHAPLIREPLTHYERRFTRDLMLAKIPAQDASGANRRLYDLRSAFISELLRARLDLETVRQLARHAKIETTLKHYARHQQGHAGDRRAEVFRVLA